MKEQINNIFFLIYFSILSGGIISVPEDYSTIQLAVNYANDSDTVLVQSGVYNENVIINNVSISLISINGPENTIIDGNNNGSVIKIDSPEQNILIQGFTIRNGIGELLDSGSRFGGGIISHNTPLILDSLIIENNDSFAGGGVCFYDMEYSQTHSVLKNSVVHNNTASEGGGVFVINQSLSISNSIINNNGMIPYGSGGGIQALLSDLNLSDVNVLNNHSRFGGGIYIASSNSIIESSNISYNLSDSKGAGIWVGNQTDLLIEETLIADNIADGFGGGIFSSFSSIEINKSTIASNLVSSNVLGAGIYADGGDIIIQNSIIYFNRREESDLINYNINGYSSDNLIEYNVEYSDIEGSNEWIPEGIGVISINPYFEVNSYFLSENSPCIDSGNPEYLDPDGTIFDMGAYYYNQNLYQEIGDINEDGIINILDIVQLVNLVLENEYEENGDFNGDGMLNVLDIVALVNIIIS